jgi:hypothetical protein
VHPRGGKVTADPTTRSVSKHVPRGGLPASSSRSRLQELRETVKIAPEKER